ncbi:biotin--[acetyl-CoA-carboxylase] ligase [Proteiniphilum sp. UBA1028]|jgi:BirA family biotin operon repressor/biotin-[acetyl-CoA-carboxylase] ligase|uniref:biotin--[acetyl-CoA-carboxylase] ligase n=1 Tax=Proteiniphilum sp. UBA1028 TaxID=1947251 RepID=UPI000E9CEC9D|nr:biotin--[acetyl-CoA-carboxylase] ligase [Proteiniphilum sp. UBA1028]HBG57990.1 biotin--[acetyl-CoA-carboxylase] ligase [Porphyromonadaceae bacterium]
MDQLSKERITIRVDEVDSTNLYLKKIAREEHPEEGSLVIAEYQTGGRGQMGTSWFSTKGENLLFSMLLYPSEVVPNEQFIISRIASLAVKNTLDHFTNDIRIKWPNDIYWKDKKIAGMLIENDIQGKYIENSVIGIGINVNQQFFPTELPNPVSLRQIVGSVQDREYILDVFMREFFLLYRDFQQGRREVIEDEYMLDLYRVNDYYWFEDREGKFQAKIEDVLPSGHLMLRTLEGDNVRRYAFKEVAFVE